MRSSTNARNRIALLALFVVGCELVGILGGLTTSVTSDWYLNLIKPPFQPPGWLFAPVWTCLYAMMGIAAFLVFERRAEDPRAKTAMTCFWLQLVLNALWTPAFFALQMPMLALIVISGLWIVLLITLVRFWQVRLAAGWLLVPYQLWITFATVLNVAIALLN